MCEVDLEGRLPLLHLPGSGIGRHYMPCAPRCLIKHCEQGELLIPQKEGVLHFQPLDRIPDLERRQVKLMLKLFAC